MPREYRHIKEYENELHELKLEGLTLKEIGDKFGFSREQVKEFFKRERRKERKIATGIGLKLKGRPPKEYVVSVHTKAAELKYILARKEAKIKALEMENELMRDFLSLTERK